MTEQEWQASGDAAVMLEYLRGKALATPRKLCLFICASLRRLPPMTPTFLDLIEVAERFVEGLASDVERRRACVELHSRRAALPSTLLANNILANILADSLKDPLAGPGVAKQEWWYGAHATASIVKVTEVATLASLAHFLRDLFPTPLLRRLPAIRPGWKKANDGLIVRLSQGIFDGQKYDQLPILSDALEEVGCDKADILDHCRTPGEHVRGCWVVDLLLGKK